MTVEDKTTVTNEKINTDDKRNVICIDKTQERTDNNERERENSVANSIVVDKIESLKEDLHVEEKAALSDQN